MAKKTSAPEPQPEPVVAETPQTVVETMPVVPSIEQPGIQPVVQPFLPDVGAMVGFVLPYGDVRPAIVTKKSQQAGVTIYDVVVFYAAGDCLTALGAGLPAQSVPCQVYADTVLDQDTKRPGTIHFLF
jgi:hypothetical protein